MDKFLLVVNAGSSSIKFTAYKTGASPHRLVADFSGQLDGINNRSRFWVKKADGETLLNCPLNGQTVPDHAAAIARILAWLEDYLGAARLLAVGHRIVHGGPQYCTPVLLNEKILQDLEGLIPLAPLHQPHNLAPVRALQKAQPSLPQVACFDTAFHQTQPAIAQRFALPRDLTAEGIRKYGFHGLSYEYVATLLPTLDAKLEKARVVVAHLGSGASLCALHEGRSVATTMGFSPLDGLVMGTRCGSIDPGVLLYLMERHNMDLSQLQTLLYHQSGLLGVSGLSSDMRTLLASDDPFAKEAIDLFVYRVGREIGSLAAALGGLQALVFTGGIGENSAQIRQQVCQQAAWLGLDLDQAANAAGVSCISTPGSKLAAWTVPTDENLMIARHTLKQIGFSEAISG